MVVVNFLLKFSIALNTLFLMNHQLQPGNSYQILYSLNGDELLYGEYKTLEEAASKFAYLKENWVDIFPEGLTAIELADQYFDEVEQFKP